MPTPEITFHLVQTDGTSMRLVPGRQYIMGRAEGVDIVLHDALASRRHAALNWEDGTFWWIEDLGSSNGLVVNGRQVLGRQQLMDGQRIQIGGQVFSYLLLPPGSDPGRLDTAGRTFHHETTIRPSSEFGELEHMGATFTGVLEDGCLDLLQFLVITRKTGRLDLFIPRHGMTWIWFVEGRITDAGFDRREGMEALLGIARERFARFAFFADARNEETPRIWRPAEQVLMEMARSADEARK